MDYAIILILIQILIWSKFYLSKTQNKVHSYVEHEKLINCGYLICQIWIYRSAILKYLKN
jgi:hypothetical protein